MTKIAIIGLGYVGKAMFNFFEKHYPIAIYDPYIDIDSLDDKIKSSMTSDKYLINNCDVSIICVPTPKADDGRCDISAVKEVLKWIETSLIILKSTVEIGTTEKLYKTYHKNIIFSPEFCGESSYWTPYKFHSDVKETPFFIFGGLPQYTTKGVDIYLKVAGPTKRYIQTDWKTAELVKYMENSFYATKIAFCYEMYEICKRSGIDWNEARELWLLDPRLNPMHTAVFEENEWPFSGKCLPKDISALVEFSKQVGYHPELLSEVISTNKRIANMRKERL